MRVPGPESAPKRVVTRAPSGEDTAHLRIELRVSKVTDAFTDTALMARQ